MIRQLVTRITTGVALFAASVSWSAWAYLNTAADPHRAEAVATAVLDDADARIELAEPLAEQIVTLSGLDASVEPQLRDAVVAVIADPRIAANLTSAVGAAHARSFGVDDPRPATIDGDLLVTAVREHLALADPGLAARIPADLVGEISVPERELPLVAGLRRLAVDVMAGAGALAIGLITFSFLAGERARTLRRYGYWAISAGLVWALGPRLLVLAARRFMTSVDATIAAAVGAATGTVTVAATVLVATGIAAIVGSRAVGLLPAGDRSPRPVRDPRRVVPPAPAVTVRPAGPPPRPAVTDAVTVTTPTTATAATTVAPIVISSAPTTVVPTTGLPADRVGSGLGLGLDEHSEPAWSLDREDDAPDPFAPLAPDPSGPPRSAGPIVAGDLPLAPRPATEVDPWALFAGPAVDPATGQSLPRRPERDETPAAGVEPGEP